MRKRVENRSRLAVLILWAFFQLPLTLLGQSEDIPPLERIVSISVTNVETRDVLDQISRQANVIFSYSSKAFKSESGITLTVANRPVRLVLNALFNGAVKYKVRGRYIILSENREEAINVNQSTAAQRTIEGYIYEPISRKKLSGVTVYDRNSMASTITNEYGYFKITLPPDDTKPDVRVSKFGYVDTVLSYTRNAFNFLAVELSLDSLKQSFSKREPKPNRDSTTWVSRWLIPKKVKINTKNLSDTLFRKVQVSVIPYLSTNQLLTGNVENNVSINIVAGYVQGVRYAEFGGVLNIDRDSVRYVQGAGVANIVGKNMRGAQMAGVLNLVMGDATAAQLAGVGNITYGSFKGVQAAGTFNYAPSVEGAQLAGTFNYASTVKGVQISGTINRARSIVGVQLAAVNSADTVDGAQVSVLNVARVAKGVQVGLVNFADSLDGVPVGLFSYVRNGYHSFEVSSDELFQANVAYRSGVKRLHGILLAGVQAKDGNNPLWTLGYGFGTSVGLARKLSLDMDLTAQQLMKGGTFLSRSGLAKGYLGLEQKLSPRLALAAGVTYSYLAFETAEQNNVQYLTSLAPHTLSSSVGANGIALQSWLGWKIALRLY